MEINAPQRESILILEDNPDDSSCAERSLSRDLPQLGVVAAHSVDEYRRLAAERDFDVVICSHELNGVSGIELIHELKLRDNDPAILVTSRSADPQTVTSIYNSGCQKCIFKGEHWYDQLAPAVRHLLRVRKLEEENRKLLAKLTEANGLLAEKNRRLDEFSATVAHDIRGPLAGISMKIEYLLDSYEKQIDKRFAELLRRALKSTDRLTSIVQVMYEFAKVGAKAAKMDAVKMSEVVESAVSDLSFDERLDIKIGIGDLPEVWGNAELLRRVMHNLITNAVKYNDKQEIIVNIGLEAISEKSLGRFAHIFVEDNGRGIAQADLKDVFAMFSRGAAEGSEVEGAGVGLSVVQRIVELHHGEIKVSSKPGEGTRFTLILPIDNIAL